jgi:hypothetical protein
LILAALERQLAKGDKALVGNSGFRRYLKTISDEHFATPSAWVRAGREAPLPLGSLLCYHKFMAPSIHVTKKSKGRPKTTGPGTQIGMRWQAAELVAIDAWRRKQDDLPSRTAAIRRLVVLGLEAGRS